MNKLKLSANGTPLNSMSDEYTSTDSCSNSDSEVHYDLDDIDF